MEQKPSHIMQIADAFTRSTNNVRLLVQLQWTVRSHHRLWMKCNVLYFHFAFFRSDYCALGVM